MQSREPMTTITAWRWVLIFYPKDLRSIKQLGALN